MFGRRKRNDEAAEAARESERLALLEELAKRPDSVCPFLGLAGDRAAYRPEPNAEHRCYAFGDPAPLSDDQQRHVCLERGYSNCPRYLRGVLVIPTEELEALRRPQPAAPPPRPPVRPPAAAAGGGNRRRGFLVVPLLVLLAAAAAGGIFYLVENPNLLAGPTGSATPQPTGVATASAQASPSIAPGQSTAASRTPGPSSRGTPTPLPTPTTGDVFVGYQVGVGPQTYTLFQVDDTGNITRSLAVGFSNYSHATVEEVVSGGLRHWRTADGGLAGYSYIAGRSGSFEIRKLYRAPDGSYHATVLPPDQI